MDRLGWDGSLRAMGTSGYIPYTTRRCQRSDGDTGFDSRTLLVTEQNPTEKLNGEQKREDGKQSAKSVQESALQLMMTQWCDLCGRHEVTLVSCNIVLLNNLMQEFGFQGFVVKTIAFVPSIWMVYHCPVHKDLEQIFWGHPLN